MIFPCLQARILFSPATLALTGLLLAPSRAPGEELLVAEPAIVQSLEGQGFSLGERLGARQQDGLDTLSQLPSFGTIVRDVDDHLAEQAATLERMRKDYDGLVRFFGGRWLKSKDARFALAGVVGRPDRIIQMPDTCGEVRLLYRLQYMSRIQPKAPVSFNGSHNDRGHQWAYRLPMTLSLVYRVPLESGVVACADSWRKAHWEGRTPGGNLKDNLFFSSIRSGKFPLQRAEINLQLSRWSYTGKSSFSDQVHYLLAAFAVQGKAWIPTGLENTPDVARLEGDEKLREGLRQWLLRPEQMSGIASGRLLVPQEFLAKSVLSVSPYHLARRANRPFTALFGASGSGTGTGAGLDSDTLSRLDGLTCQGCHQSHGTAGFHFLGEPDRRRKASIFLLSGRSLHFKGALTWRQAVMGSGHWFGDEVLPRSEKLGVEPGGLGDVCTGRGRGCKAGLACLTQFPTSELLAGICLPMGSKDGNPCDDGALLTSSNSLFDRWQPSKSTPCPLGSICAESNHGFPQGLCSRRCGGGDAAEGMVCVPVPQLGPYENCLNEGRPFVDCAREFSIPSLMPACSDQSQCRPDYGCFGLSELKASGLGHQARGFCAPIYVDPELTVEHHPQL